MKKAILFILFTSFVFSNSFAQKPVVEPLMTSTWQTFQWPLNAAFPLCSADTYGAVNGHLGNSCGPTAIAKLLHYHRHPVHGEGTYSCTDEFGIAHNFNFGNTYFKWNLMRDEFLAGAEAEDYMPTAWLVYFAYGMMEDPGNTGRSIYDVSNMLKKHMRYSSSAYVAYRFDYSRQEYIDLLKTELDAGRPLLIESWSSNSTPPGESGNHEGHYWNIDGYDDQDRFHVVWNNGNYTTWIDIHSMTHPDFDAYYIWALIQAKPDNTGKEFAFTTPGEGHMFKMNEAVSLSWQQQNIDNFDIDFRYGGDDWITIGENISAASGSWSWSGPDQYSKDASFRIRDVGNVYYDFYFSGYQSYETEQLSLITPVEGDDYENGTKMCLAWNSDGIYELQLEAKESGTDEWQMINRNIPARERFIPWSLPSGSGIEYDVRLSTEDHSFVQLAENIRIVSQQQTGGPYKKDVHTMLIMHFDNNLDEECYQAEVINELDDLTFDISAPGKGAALHLDNSAIGNKNAVLIPHEDFLSQRGSFTVDLWFKINSWDKAFNNKPNIINKPAMGTRPNYSLTGYAATGSLVFKVRTTAGDVEVECTQGIIVPGVWYHAAMIHDETIQEIKLQIHNDKKERIDEQTGYYPEGAGVMTGSYDILIGKKSVGSSYLDGCVDELRISRSVRDFNAVWSGIEESPVDDISFRVYPNPASDLIHIELPDGLGVTGCALLDMKGRTLRRDLEDAHEGRDLKDAHKGRVRTVNVSGLSAGLYWVVVETEGGRFSEKVVIK